MRREKAGQILIFIVWFIIYCAPALHAGDKVDPDHQKIVLHTGFQDNDGFPLVMGKGSEIGDPPGIGVDIILRVARDINITLKTRRLPNKRVHGYLRSGYFDASGFYSFNEKHMKMGRFPMKSGRPDPSKRIDVISYHFYGRDNSQFSWDGQFFTGTRTVGANMGYSIVRDLKAMGIQVNEVKTTRQNLDMLLKGRIQAYAAQDKTIDPVIASNQQYRSIIKFGPPIKTKAYYFVFSHQFYEKKPEIAQKIWDQIEIVRESVITHYREHKISPRLY